MPRALHVTVRPIHYLRYSLVTLLPLHCVILLEEGHSIHTVARELHRRQEYAAAIVRWREGSIHLGGGVEQTIFQVVQGIRGKRLERQGGGSGVKGISHQER